MSAAAPRTAFVNHSAELGGGELALLDLVRRTPDAFVILLSTGVLTTTLARDGIAHRTIDAGRVLDIRRDDGLLTTVGKLPALAALVGRLAAAVRSHDVVYANSQKAFVAAALASLLSGLGSGPQLIWHLHDILTAEHFSGPMRTVSVKLSNRFARTVIANSAATAEAYRTAGGRAPVVVVHNGIDPAPFDPGRRDAHRAALAAMIGSGSAPILGVFGRLAAWKGQQVAIAALSRLPDCHLVLVGGSLFGEHAYEAELREQVAAAGLGDRVHFLGFRQDVPPLMAGVDVALHCSIAPEPFGRVIVEAMMARTPVIATAAGGAMEIITDGQDGLLIPPGDAERLAGAVRSLIDEPPFAREVAANGRRTAVDRFSLDASVIRLHAVIAAAAGRAAAD